MDVHILLSIVFPSSICSTLQLCALHGSFNIRDTLKILHRTLRLLRPLAQSLSFKPPTTLICEQQTLLLSNRCPVHLLFDVPSRWFCVLTLLEGKKGGINLSNRDTGVPQGHVLSPPFVYSLHKLLYQSITYDTGVLAHRSIFAQSLHNHLLLLPLLPWQPGTNWQWCSDVRSVHLWNQILPLQKCISLKDSLSRCLFLCMCPSENPREHVKSVTPRQKSLSSIFSILNSYTYIYI